MKSFEIVSEITDIEPIASGSSVRERAELHWYEAHGIGKKEIKRKRYLD